LLQKLCCKKSIGEAEAPNFTFKLEFILERKSILLENIQTCFNACFISWLGSTTRLMFHYSSCFTSFFMQDPVVDLINAAVDRLSNSTNFLNFMAQHALIMHDELPTPSEEHVDDERYHFMSLLLNLANTFLYMINTYIIVPTADDYSTSLGAAPTVCGIVIGAMAVAQVFSSVYFSAWSNKSYFRPLVFSSIALFVGNIFYACAYDVHSIWILLIGRLFCG
jgi:hypothetical protein